MGPLNNIIEIESLINIFSILFTPPFVNWKLISKSLNQLLRKLLENVVNFKHILVKDSKIVIQKREYCFAIGSRKFPEKLDQELMPSYLASRLVDYRIRRYLEDKVYCTPYNTVEELGAAFSKS